MPMFQLCQIMFCWLLFAANIGNETYYKCQFRVPNWTKGYQIASKNYLDEIEPAVQYPRASKIKTFATPGEYEQVAFVIYASKDLKNVQIKVSTLRSENGEVVRENLILRKVMRLPRRFTYYSPPRDSRVVSWFLLPFKPFRLNAGHFQEVWLTIKVPDQIHPGIYSGKIIIETEKLRATNIPLILEVFPFKLTQTSKKRYGVYHDVSPDTTNLKNLKRELADIREHGGTLIYPSVQIQYAIQSAYKVV